jgi:hypothetical protein
MTAFFLIEWIYYGEKVDKHKSLGDFRQEIKSVCAEVQIIQDIATGAKYFELTTQQPKQKEQG